MPGFRLSVSALVPPWKVGVAPRTLPLGEAIVTLCATGELLVNWTVTLPAFALNDFVLYLSVPLGSAESFTAALGDADDAGVEADALELVEGADDALLLELDELPHPESTIAPSRRTEMKRRLIRVSFRLPGPRRKL